MQIKLKKHPALCAGLVFLNLFGIEIEDLENSDISVANYFLTKNGESVGTLVFDKGVIFMTAEKNKNQL